MFIQLSKKQQQNESKENKYKHNDHSILPDLYTGWQHKSIPNITIKQIPLIFAHTSIDFISKSLTSFGSQLPYKVVYMGFRPSSNMKLFKQYAENKFHKIVQQSFLYSKKSFKRFQFSHYHEPQKFFPIRPSEYRLFKGVNPTSKSQDIKFSSQFQGGNLDLAIASGPDEYDLIMRVDSNTKGHTCWYFFKVFDIKKKKKVKFNIINFTKGRLLYEDGMKPYVFKKSKMQWTQDGTQIEYKNKAFRYFERREDQVVQKCLSFTYQFDLQDQEVYFAYSIPYSYSYLLEFLEQIQQKHPQFIKVNYGKESSGGLAIPILTITNFTTQNEKQNHLAIGRLHPGQTQGSWMMEGFLKYICSPEAHYLRQKVEFKIIPMVNVDGVVLGNFRTGISGRDLNRVFHKAKSFQEIKIIEELARQFKPEVFLDFHGHSAKKNVFIYGPQYRIDERDYLMCRIFPKIISKKTQAFRYYGCQFKISESKVNTGRALLFYEYKTRFVFTIEASTFAYGYSKEAVLFNSQRYLDVGSKIAQSLQDFIKIIIKIPKKMDPNNLLESVSKASLSKNEKNDPKSKKKIIINQDIQPNQNEYFSQLLEQINSLDISKDLLKQILQNESELNKNQKIKQKQSESDCEDQKQDYTDQQLKNLQKSNNGNKNDPAQQLIEPKFKSYKNSKKKYKKIRQKTIETNNLYTLEVIPKKQLNKSLLLRNETLQSQDFTQQKSQEKLKQLDSPQKRSRNQKKFDRNFYQRMIDCSMQKMQKLRKLQAWKSNQLKKYEQLQSLNINRNKSANQVYLQCPPASDLDRLHKIKSDLANQHKKKEPVFSIKRSFLPSVVLKNNTSNNSRNQSLQIMDDYQCQKEKEKNLINQILELHQKKKRKNQQKMSKKLKIYFSSGN